MTSPLTSHFPGKQIYPGSLNPHAIPPLGTSQVLFTGTLPCTHLSASYTFSLPQLKVQFLLFPFLGGITISCTYSHDILVIQSKITKNPISCMHCAGCWVDGLFLPPQRDSHHLYWLCFIYCPEVLEGRPWVIITFVSPEHGTSRYLINVCWTNGSCSVLSIPSEWLNFTTVKVTQIFQWVVIDTSYK